LLSYFSLSMDFKSLHGSDRSSVHGCMFHWN
jgi:hypothetical protein